MSDIWKAWFDGATVPNPGERGIGALLISPDGSERIEISEAIGFGTNNEAEYAALQSVLDYAIKRGIDRLVTLLNGLVNARNGLYGYEPRGREFESLRARHKFKVLAKASALSFVAG